MSGHICQVCWLGQMDYAVAWDLQKELAGARGLGRSPDTLLLLEHTPTYTMGRRNSEDQLLVSRKVLREQGIRLYQVDRGGGITYHGPGQLVGYPVVSLLGRPGGPSRYLRMLEEVIIRGLRPLGIKGTRLDGFTGVWVGGEKIAAIGVKISAQRITGHGFSLNVSPDLQFFKQIIPCGIPDKGVTSIARLLGRPLPLIGVASRMAEAFGEVFEMTLVEVPRESIFEVLPSRLLDSAPDGWVIDEPNRIIRS